MKSSAIWNLIIYLIVIFIILGLYYFITYHLFTIDQNAREIPNLVIQVLITVTLSLAFINYTFSKNQEKEFFEALSNLVDELFDNLERLSDEGLNHQFERVRDRATNRDWIGFDKLSSFTNWGSGNNFYLKYLPNTAYYYFITKGFFGSDMSEGFNEGMREIVAKTYFKFDLLNIKIQELENQYLGYGRELPDNYREIYIERITPVLKIYHTENFFLESLNLVKLIQNAYPSLKNQEKILNLERKIQPT